MRNGRMPSGLLVRSGLVGGAVGDAAAVVVAACGACAMRQADGAALGALG